MRTITEFKVEEMRLAATDACAILKVLSNPERLRLLCELSQGECCVNAFITSLDIQQPTLSQQLAVLRKAGLVDTRREGKNIYYRIAKDEVLLLLQTLHSLFCVKPANKTGRKKNLIRHRGRK